MHTPTLSSIPTCTLASSPGLLIGGRMKEGLVSTACACAVIIQILNNPIMYGYHLYTLTNIFTVNVALAHAVDTRPSPPSPQSEGLGTRLHVHTHTHIHTHRHTHTHTEVQHSVNTHVHTNFTRLTQCDKQ